MTADCFKPQMNTDKKDKRLISVSLTEGKAGQNKTGSKEMDYYSLYFIRANPCSSVAN